MEYEKMMREYQDLAKYITQMAAAALIIPVIFIRDIMGKANTSQSEELNIYIYISWLLLFISIGFGIWYQYIATKKIIEGRGKRVRKPELVFGIMMSFFYIGVGLFILGVVNSR